MTQGFRRRPGSRRYFPRRKVCAFCVDKVTVVDYKDVSRLRRYLTVWAKVEPRRKSGNCTPHQRALSVAIKRARFVGLLPFSGSHSLIELGRPEYPRGDRRFGGRERYSPAPAAAPPAPAPETPDLVPAAVESAPLAEETSSAVAVETAPLVEETPSAVAVETEPVAEETPSAVAVETEPVAEETPSTVAVEAEPVAEETPSAVAVEPESLVEETPSTVDAPVETPLTESKAEPVEPAEKSTPAPRRRTTKA